MPVSPMIEITYCRLCGWGLRAGWMAQELLTTFAEELGSVTLTPDRSDGDVFDSESLAFDSETLCSQLSIAPAKSRKPSFQARARRHPPAYRRRSSSLRSLFEAQTHPA